ncbi:CadC family transcriptional regulator [Klebsiella indica]|uniref:CadC family transcriptional regulator n=1 Tax=Klebsiella indica TaxID=2582917 RepID=A0A5R9LLW4_9ENTR|nr:winged helix-turn-helix domain-containing protein [Klebsiella indica]TLV21596.1 CadC family transcriptional regulator [Klebsiella indica]
MEKTYTINGRIAFIPQRSTLILIPDNSKRVLLNIPACRCLLLLIQQDGEIVARDAFFQEVWIKHGLQVTNNCFYQNISLLRRAFKQLGVGQEIIVTVPRVGVRLDAQLAVIESPSDTQETVPLIPVATAEVATASPPEKKRLRPQFPLIWAVAALLSCLIMGFIAWQTEFDSYLQRYLPVNVKTSQQCYFFANNDVVDHYPHEKFSDLNHFECKTYPWIYLTLYPGQARVSVISCRQPFSLWRDNQCLTSYYIK